MTTDLQSPKKDFHLSPVWAAPLKNIKIKINCPRCGSADCDRIPRGALVRLLLPWAAVKHYRCARCLKKFYKPK